jgi:hypothetical protein
LISTSVSDLHAAADPAAAAGSRFDSAIRRRPGQIPDHAP